MRKPKLPDFGSGDIRVTVGSADDIPDEVEYDHIEVTVQLTQLPSRGSVHMPAEAGDYFILQALDEEGCDVKDKLTPRQIEIIDKEITDKDLLGMLAEDYHDKRDPRPYERPWQ